MNVLIDGHYAEDAWTLVGPEDVLPAGDVIVPLARWRETPPQAWQGRRVGVLLDGDSEIGADSFDPAPFELIAVAFEPFTDGRGYSIARTLRQRGFSGDLRAVGEIRRDQALFLLRCGFSSLAADSPGAAEELRRGLTDQACFYQPAADARVTVPALRSRRA